MLCHDSEDISTLIDEFSFFAKDFFSSLDLRNAGVVKGLSEINHTLPYDSLGVSKAIKVFKEKYFDYISASVGNRYFGFVTGGVTYAALIGDWITSLIDQNAIINSESFTSGLEQEVICRIIKGLNLPNTFSGNFVTGATMSNSSALAIAREWLGYEDGLSVSENGFSSIDNYTIISATPHSSIFKSLSLLGFGRKSLVKMNTVSGYEKIDLDSLEKFLTNNPRKKHIIVCNFGTVSSTEFDDIIGIQKLKKRFNLWIHVDGAFGAWVRYSKKYSHLAKGLEYADSITLDCHKWLNVPYDSGIILTKWKQLQFAVHRNNASYISINKEMEKDFINLSPENSRRLRALPVWFNLVAYGNEGVSKIIERCCEIAKIIEKKLLNDKSFIILSETKLNVVCFTINKKKYPNLLIENYITSINTRGNIFLTPVTFRKMSAIRICICNWKTSANDINVILDELKFCLTP